MSTQKILHLCLGLQMNGHSRDQALWSFVEYVIPDIGVLKSYGPFTLTADRLIYKWDNHK